MTLNKYINLDVNKVQVSELVLSGKNYKGYINEYRLTLFNKQQTLSQFDLDELCKLLMPYFKKTEDVVEF